MLPLARFVLEGCCSIHLSYGRGLYANNLTRSGWRPVKHPRRPDSENVVPPAAPNAVQDPPRPAGLGVPAGSIVVEDRRHGIACTHSVDVRGPAAPHAVEDQSWCGLRALVHLRGPLDAVVVENCALPDGKDVGWPAAPDAVEVGRGPRGLGTPVRPVVVEDRAYGAHHVDVRRSAAPHALEHRGHAARLRTPTVRGVVEDRPVGSDGEDVRRVTSPGAHELLAERR